MLALALGKLFCELVVLLEAEGDPTASDGAR